VIYYVKNERREKIINSSWKDVEKDALKVSKKWEDVVVLNNKNAQKIDY
jgi:hypothetical protein